MVTVSGETNGVYETRSLDEYVNSTWPHPGGAKSDCHFHSLELLVFEDGYYDYSLGRKARAVRPLGIDQVAKVLQMDLARLASSLPKMDAADLAAAIR
jgi:hypothetical protein